VKAAIFFNGQSCLFRLVRCQDRDLGRKFESGTSKRKRKAELQRKNPELCGSLLKLLKRNGDASVSNKD
jgi:hypothetical protein